MQGYVTELILTLEAVVETLDSNFRPMDLMRVSWANSVVFSLQKRFTYRALA